MFNWQFLFGYFVCFLFVLYSKNTGKDIFEFTLGGLIGFVAIISMVILWRGRNKSSPENSWKSKKGVRSLTGSSY
jgi:hypothetical protein